MNYLDTTRGPNACAKEYGRIEFLPRRLLRRLNSLAACRIHPANLVRVEMEPHIIAGRDNLIGRNAHLGVFIADLHRQQFVRAERLDDEDVRADRVGLLSRREREVLRAYT